MIYFKLFIIFARIGLLTYGGGYAIIAVILDVLKENDWITTSEFSNLITISQITPGPIAINAATFVGYKVAKFFGAFFATFGISVPAFFLTMIMYNFYSKLKENENFKNVTNSLRISALALMCSALIIFTKDALFIEVHNTSWVLKNIDFIKNTFKHFNIIGVFIFIISLILHYKKMSIIKIILISSILGILLY